MITAGVVAAAAIIPMVVCVTIAFIKAKGVLLNPHPKFSNDDKRFREIAPVKTQNMFDCKVV